MHSAGTEATNPLDGLDISSSPGQEKSLSVAAACPVGDGVDFSHGDVGAFPPIPGAFDLYRQAVADGRRYAYSRYRGHGEVREHVARHVGEFTGRATDPWRDIIVTPGTQGALFLAMSSLVEPGDKVAVVVPDYFANSRIVTYLRAQAVPVILHYQDPARAAELDLADLADAFASGVKLLVLSNPNNPTGAVYTSEQIREIAVLAEKHGAFVVVDQLYARLIYPGTSFTHLRTTGIADERCLTLLGPSKTESLSGFRVGVAIGAPHVIERMEKLQALVSLRAPGYSQAVLGCWFAEPPGWLDHRIEEHQSIRDDLYARFHATDGFSVRLTEGGSYIFPQLPALRVPPAEFRNILRFDHGITVTPGGEFGPGHDRSIRLNFSQQRDKALEAVSIICDLAVELAA
ncbi:pyridoxal phosphate-dependent aminotransferase [Mycolicibacterium smegmatis]|uniref:PLP-dependent aminotransferase n=1 Tax=Mycolicibacterium smegmatis (strain MKD8) TaxID=1214915 RepID=A0A2U9PTC0_MYCSE|nr:pyridoxal phosphate-dependent aminotransferase [Mycolicibacterium smegmatis]AWT55026.1 PLP-dependent aminotransferase [Mycolicibacterium smegmatis MKD8]